VYIVSDGGYSFDIYIYSSSSFSLLIIFFSSSSGWLFVWATLGGRSQLTQDEVSQQ
jgi:hypothetical protein